MPKSIPTLGLAKTGDNHSMNISHNSMILQMEELTNLIPFQLDQQPSQQTI
jgi:hypothetical protein